MTVASIGSPYEIDNQSSKSSQILHCTHFLAYHLVRICTEIIAKISLTAEISQCKLIKAEQFKHFRKGTEIKIKICN